MVTINATEARNNIGKLWSKAADGPVTVLSAGQPVAVVLSPSDFDKLTARRHSAKAGFAKHLFAGVDMNALLDVSLDDVFTDYSDDTKHERGSS